MKFINKILNRKKSDEYFKSPPGDFNEREFQKTRDTILEYSISILLSAGKREQNDLMSFEEQLKDLMDKNSKNDEL